MWVESLPNGKFKFCERYTDPLTGRVRRVSVTLAKDNKYTRKDAAAILAQKIESTSTPALKGTDLSLQELGGLYLAYQEKNVSKSTWKRNTFAINTICRLLNPAALVSNLTAGYVSQNLYQQDEKPATKNERLTRFKALIRWGYQNDYISDIRWLDKLRPVNDREAKEKLQSKFLEKDELVALTQAMTVQKYKWLTQFMALSGMRVGEALALTVNDVDFKEKLIHIDKTFDSVNQIISVPKTASSNRDVYIQPELLSLCQEIKKDLNSKRFKNGIKTNLFFTTEQGEMIQYYAFNKYLRETSERVLGRKITTHVLRHTHVSLLAEAFVPLETITRRVGHDSSKITKEIYLHVTERMKERDKQIMDRVTLLA